MSRDLKKSIWDTEKESKKEKETETEHYAIFEDGVLIERGTREVPLEKK